MCIFHLHQPKKHWVSVAEQRMLAEVLVSLTTGPLLLGILGARTAANLLQDIGQVSEEIFRGERLPILNFPYADSFTDD